MITLGERLHKLRKHHEWTLQELADHVGISPSHVSLIESNKALPSLPVLKRFGVVFGLTVREMLGGVKGYDEEVGVPRELREALENKATWERIRLIFLNSLNLLDFSELTSKPYGEEDGTT